MMKTVFFALILAAGTALAAADALINNNLDQSDSIRQWAQIPGMTYQSQGGVNDSGCLKFTYAEGADNRKISEIMVPLDQVRGRGVTLSAMLKGDNIAKPQLSYLGPALALKIVSPGGTVYAGHTKQYGSYDWRQATAFCNIPKDATMVSIIIGLQQSGGTLYVDNLRLDVMPDPDQIKFNPAIQLQNPKLNAFRGVMIGHDLSQDAFRELGEVWNVNVIRFWIDKDKINDHNTEQGFRTIVRNRLKVLDEILPYLRKYNINVIIDMHVGPGAKVTELSSNDLSWDPKMQDLLTDVWREIAARYKDEPAVWGYDLLNEPREDNFVYKPGGGLDWNGLADKISRAIREVDPDTPIIVECAQWGHPAGFETLRPVSVNNVIYSFHYYQPHSYTHQGIHGRPDNIVYPGVIDGKLWNREQMVQSMKPVIDFQQKYNVPIYVGEFSVALWAPGADQYLEDCISIFEEHAWSWTYHSFREYHGWDAEMTGPLGQGKRVGDTPRRRILLKYMKNNVRELKQLEPVKKETAPPSAVRQEELKSELDTPGKTPPPDDKSAAVKV